MIQRQCVISFCLTNVLVTFYTMMNIIIREEIKKCVLVYLNDIIIFSKSLNEHITHLIKILTTNCLHIMRLTSIIHFLIVIYLRNFLWICLLAYLWRKPFRNRNTCL